MADLFGDTGNRTVPLAETLRPTTLDDVVGQQHLIGAGKPLRLAIESRTPHSMILWGPPGVGKTTLARILAHAFDAEFTPLSAVFSGVKDIREAVERAQMAAARGRHTILFVDEVHRFNKYVTYLKNQVVKLIYCAVIVPQCIFQPRRTSFLGLAQHG